MADDIIERSWKQLKGRVRERWGSLTDRDLAQISGRREHLLAVLQERYGLERDNADRQLREFEQSL